MFYNGTPPSAEKNYKQSNKFWWFHRSIECAGKLETIVNSFLA